MAFGGLVIGLCLSWVESAETFEAAGAFAVLMIAIYYFAQIFLVGALITRVYAHRYGSMRERSKISPTPDLHNSAVRLNSERLVAP